MDGRSLPEWTYVRSEAGEEHRPLPHAHPTSHLAHRRLGGSRCARRRRPERERRAAGHVGARLLAEADLGGLLEVDGDTTQYWLAPGGDFEAGSKSWSLSGRASLVSGNEPWKLAGSDDTRSLRLPPGASATSPVVCVGIEHPAVRLFAKSESGLLPTLAVDVITETSLGLKLAVPAGVLLPNGKWKPSPKLVVLSSLLPLLPGEHTPVQFRVTSVGLGTWSVDDFYIDPRCH